MEIYDSTRPALIPAGSHACLYWDGDYRATPAQAKRFAAVRWITVLGGKAAAAHTGCIDFEKGNEAYDPARLRAWAEERKEMGCRARVYCDRADHAAAQKAVAGLANVCWWIATLDEDKLHATWTKNLWAVQYAGGVKASYDTSVLYGTW
jgi:hypothetical protein